MRSDVKNRSDREAELYDKQRLRRARFESALTYLNDGVGRQGRNEAIRVAMREATGSQVLEIGSQSWEWCLARYGYRPAQLTCINISQTELEIGRAQAAKLGVSCDFRKMDAHDLEFADGVSTWCSDWLFYITLSLTAHCAKSTGYFETADGSFSSNRYATIRSPASCVGLRRTPAPRTSCR